MRTLSEPDDDGRPPAPSASTGGDTAASAAVVAEFTAFYHDSAPRLVAFLRWQGAPLPDAADCAQEALVLAFRRWGTLHHPHAWCRATASRLYVRRVAAVREHPVEDLDRVAGAVLLAPETEIEELEQRHTVLALLERLPSRQRQVMAWTYDGATPAEIAGELRTTPEAVRSTLYKARKALRTVAGEDR